MGKHIHSTLLAEQPIQPSPDIHAHLQITKMEAEFSSELALLQTLKLQPRTTAVEQLLTMIAQQNVAEHH